MVFSRLLPDADQIDRWADSRSAEAALPRLVRRLITATTMPEWIDMAAGTAVRFHGWDGVVRVASGTAQVPEGLSYWEMGTNADARDKAQRDYRKRTNETDEEVRKSASFVFISPRHWEDRDDWLELRRSEGLWAHVEALDASGLETWLETAPHVHLWLSQELDSRIVGTRSLENWWEEWADLSRPHRLNPEILLHGRESEARHLVEWLEADPRSHVLRGNTSDEVVAFVAAALSTPDSDSNASLLRSVVVADAEAWRQLVVVPQPLILIPEFSDPWLGRAIDRGHHVIVPAGPDDPSVPEVTLAERTQEQLSATLAAQFGLDPRQASDLVAGAAGSLKALRRSLSQVEEFRRPAWTDPANAKALAPALLVGSWDAGLEGDRDAVAAVAQRDYTEVEADLTRLAEGTDPPVRQRGSVWITVDRRDLWLLIRDSVSGDTWDSFARATADVLGAPDPALTLPAGERWMANVLGKGRPHSQRIRQGFATSLAMLGGWVPLLRLGGGRAGPEFANVVASRLLADVNRDATGDGWISLGSILSLIAEAAPIPFLSAVAVGLRGEDPVLGRLINDVDSGGLFGSTPQAPVLWALETLAWSPDLVAEVAEHLRDWAHLDPGGRVSNRPGNSFRQIFLPWHPQTSATSDERLAALRATREGDKDSAWPLLRDLLPKPNDITGETSRPRWRDWAAQRRLDVTRSEYLQVVGEVLQWLLEDAGKDGKRWASLVEAYDDLPEPMGDRLLAALEGVDAAALQEEARDAITAAIRSVTSRHRAFPDAKWALPLARIEPLRKAGERLAPRDLGVRHRWLFASHPDTAAVSGGDFAAYDEALAKRRFNALNEILAAGGLNAVNQLVDVVEQPESVGWAMGSNSVWPEVNLADWASSADQARRRAAAGFVRARTRDSGVKWLDDWLQATRGMLSDDQAAELLLGAAPDRSLWALVETLGQTVETRYWQGFYGFPGGEEASIAAIKLTQFGRPYEALDLIAGATLAQKDPLSPEIALDALRAASRTPPPTGQTLSMFTHALPALLDRLESAGADTSELATYEWVYLAIFEDRERAPRRLSEGLARDPAFFVEVLSAAFRGDDEAPREQPEADVVRAKQAYRLLSLWKQPPGTTGEGFDGRRMTQWVHSARDLLVGARRSEIGDEQIGQVLWWSPAGSDGVHPHEAVRNLIEDLHNTDIERGFTIAGLNSRGVHIRSSRNGDDERALAADFAGRAAALQESWPRTAAALRAIADSYLRDAARHDEDAELEKLDEGERSRLQN